MSKNDKNESNYGAADASTNIRIGPTAETPFNSPNNNKADDEDGMPTFLAERASAVMRKHTRGARGSILSEQFTKQITPVVGKEAASKITSAAAMQMCAFFTLVTFTGTTPTLLQAVQGAPGDYIREMVYIIDFIISMVVGNLLSGILYGSQGVLDCWNWRAVLRWAPVMSPAAFAECMQVDIMAYLDGTTWRLVKQLKLPMTAIAIYVFLRRRTTSATQWIIIVCICFAVLGYCLQISKQLPTHKGLLLAVISVSLTTCGGVLGDVAYKSVPFPMCTQIAQGRIVSFVVVMTKILFDSFVMHKPGYDKFPFGGITWQMLLLCPWLSLKDWTGSYVLKHLDSLWKCLATVLSIGVAYFLDLVLGKKKFEVVAFMFVLVVMTNVFAFALTKRDQASLKKVQDEVAGVKCH